MKIADATVQFDSEHFNYQRHELKERLNQRGSNRTLGSGITSTRPAGSENPVIVPSSLVHLSAKGETVNLSETNPVQQGIEAAESDPVLSLIKALISMLLGKEITVLDREDMMFREASPQTPPTQGHILGQGLQRVFGPSLEYDRNESYTEKENTRFTASGVIRTEDGRDIHFSLMLSMSREFHEESAVSIRLGGGSALKDPLVINFSGNVVQLSSQRFRFDIDSDGKTDVINFVSEGSGFLVLDRNEDGKITNGKELFGATSRDGFRDLLEFDTDNNGWIDENDTIYERLHIWFKDNSGNDQFRTLKQSKVGAISLDRVETPFALKDANNTLLGQVRTSGVYLQEDGEAGSIQQIDLSV